MDLSPLNRFTERVNKLRAGTLETVAIRATRAVALTIRDYVREIYDDANVSLIGANSQNGTVTAILAITAQDLWFREFGTGFVGAASPSWEYQPTMELTFFSRGGIQHTSGWEYAYHPLTKKMLGWWYTDETGKSVFTAGQPAEHGVTSAIIRVKSYGVPGLADFIREYLR